MSQGWWYGCSRALSDGDPNLLAANRNDDGRHLNAYYDSPSNRWNRDNGFAFAVSQLSLISTLRYVRGVVLLSWPFHPPSIRPTSSSIIDKFAYPLVSSALVSQRIIKRTFKVSTFLMARRTYGCLSVPDKNPAWTAASIPAIKSPSICCPRVYRCGFGNFL